MITYKLHITSCSDSAYIKDKCTNYAYAYHLLYNIPDASKIDKSYIEYIKYRFNLTNIEYRSLCSEVIAAHKAEDAIMNNKKIELEDLKDDLLNEDLNKHDKFKTFRKIAKLESAINDYEKNGFNCVFGSKYLLKSITSLHNKKNKLEKEISSTDDSDKLSKLNDDLKSINERIDKNTDKYRHKRSYMPFYLIGDSYYSGNRFVDLLDINKDKMYILLKITKYEHVYIECKISSKIRKTDLKHLMDVANSNNISVTYRFDEEFVYISFNEEELKGYNVTKRQKNKVIAEVKSKNLTKEQTSEEIVKGYALLYKNLNEKKLLGKNPNRYISVDLNPDYIGVSVLEQVIDIRNVDELQESDKIKVYNNEYYKIIDVVMYDLSYFSIKRNKKSSHWLPILLNNKRKQEIALIFKQIFNIARHYQCAYFVMEDLNFSKSKKKLSKEANRKIKNLWHLTLTKNQIIKRCHVTGITLIEVESYYSSFIGNIQHDYVDPINAAIEIGRRGIARYNKNMDYPYKTGKDINTLYSLFGELKPKKSDAFYKTTVSWVSTYNTSRELFKDSAIFSNRWRLSLEDTKHVFKV